MGPAVVPGQDLTEAAGPVRHGALADLATGDRQWVGTEVISAKSGVKLPSAQGQARAE